MPEVRATKTERELANEVKGFANDVKDSKTSTLARMSFHVLQKGWQYGSLLASTVVGPALMYQAGGNWEVLITTAGQGGVAGMCLAGALGAAKLAVEPFEAVEDRARKLRYNETQKRLDLFSGVGVVSGLGVAYARREPQWTVWDYIGHAAVGAAAGVALHSITSKQSIEDEGEAAIKGVTRNVRDVVDRMK